MAKSKIRIAIADPGDMPLFTAILDFVRDSYDFEFTTDLDADFVLHSGNGYGVLRYSGVRIFATGENVSPSFSLSDYALGFNKLSYGDRYLWLPLIRLYGHSYRIMTEPRLPASEVMAMKTGFCAYVMSNTSQSAPERSKIFDLLSAYKTVNSGGGWRNNVGGRVKDKVAFQTAHKFVIAFENTSFPGYLTEKIGDAAASHAVPIYWGDPEVAQIINPKAFINCHDFPTLRDAVEHVIKVDQDDALYRAMLAEPWFVGGREPEALSEATCAGFLRHIFEQEPAEAFRRSRGRWATKHEESLYRAFFRPHLQLLRTLRGWFSR